MRQSRSYSEFKSAIEADRKDEYMFDLATKNPDYNFVLENGVELFSYRCFLLLVATEDVRGTAKLMRMSQFGLYRRLLGLQQKIGIRLVESSEKWIVTPDGIEFAKILAPRIEKFYAAIRSIQDTNT